MTFGIIRFVRQRLVTMISTHSSTQQPGEQLLSSNMVRYMNPPRLRNLNSVANVEFGLLSWNILSQDLIGPHAYLYTQCPPHVLDWTNRWPKIRNHLSQSCLSIVCLQEVNSVHYFYDIKPFMESRGFRSIYKKRGSEKHDGCAMFYRPNIFRLEVAKRVDFNQDIISDGQRRDNVAIIARFRPVHPNNNKKLVVATTHLLFNPRRGDIKLAQLRMLLAELRSMSLRPDSGYYPIILCGDFNIQPNSPIYNFIMRGSVNPIGLGRGELSGQENNPGRLMEQQDLVMKGIDMNCQFKDNQVNGQDVQIQEVMVESPGSNAELVLSHDFHFRTVFPPIQEDSDCRFVSTCIQGEASLVDYIFFVSSGHLACRDFRGLPTSSDIEDFACMPNDKMPSDHFSLQASFILTP